MYSSVTARPEASCSRHYPRLMSYNLIDLNEETRRRMLDEFEADVAKGAVFHSAIVAPADESRYLDVHRDAFAAGG